MDPVISTRALTKHYGRTVALDSLDLVVSPGSVFGYLGPNGAGKTTTIRLLAGLLRPTSGVVQVLGMDCVAEADRVQAKIGYLPGEFVAYPDLTGEQYLRYMSNLRGRVDWAVVESLANRFGLDLSGKVGALSHGNRQKVGVIQAFMHRPEVLILDEPSAGLDPLMQREFRALVRESAEAGCTVFLSSHILTEVEAVADIVAILREGRLVAVESVEALKSAARRRVDVTFDRPPPTAMLEALGNVREVRVDGSAAQVVVEGSTSELFERLAPYGISSIVTHEADLEDVFLAYYRSGV